MKVRENENDPPRCFGLLREGRLVCFHDVECDPGDGWEDPDVHGDSEAKRTKALQMGVNIVRYAFGGAENRSCHCTGEHMTDSGFAWNGDLVNALRA